MCSNKWHVKFTFILKNKTCHINITQKNFLLTCLLVCHIHLLVDKTFLMFQAPNNQECQPILNKLINSTSLIIDKVKHKKIKFKMQI